MKLFIIFSLTLILVSGCGQKSHTELFSVDWINERPADIKRDTYLAARAYKKAFAFRKN